MHSGDENLHTLDVTSHALNRWPYTSDFVPMFYFKSLHNILVYSHQTALSRVWPRIETTAKY